MVRKDNKEQIRRIAGMERRLTRASAALKRLSSALDKYEEVQEDFAALNDYYGSNLWKQDFLDDEAGRLPQDLKRGVLSEDGIWNLLEAHRELQERQNRLKIKD